MGARHQASQDAPSSCSPVRKFSLVSFGNTLAKSAVEPILSLKDLRITRQSGNKLLVFLLKVGALELIRRGSMAHCPQLWWGIQGLSLLQVPPFVFLQQWAPFRYLVHGAQVFSRPIIFLSLATTITDKLDELRGVEECAAREVQTACKEEPSTSSTGGPSLAICPANVERQHVAAQRREYEAENLLLLKEDLERARITLPERINDDELERFLVANNGNVQRCVLLIKRTVRWRNSFYFFPPEELESWSPLVFWHGYDVQMRPSLVIRIGWAYTILKTHERPRFTQAILSHIEYGVTNLLCEEDPRITVIIDCEGMPALGFPVHMFKSCCILVQENYPTRLAALFLVNLPPVVRVIAQAIIQDENAEEAQSQNDGEAYSKIFSLIQILKPTTKKKIHVEGDQYTRALTAHYGGSSSIPCFLGGSCTCSNCQKAASTKDSTSLQVVNREQSHAEAYNEAHSDKNTGQQELASSRRFNSVLRAIIVGLLMFWVIMCLLADFFDPDSDFIPR